jgi:hypothetical protein
MGDWKPWAALGLARPSLGFQKMECNFAFRNQENSLLLGLETLEKTYGLSDANASAPQSTLRHAERSAGSIFF